jgi:hypothetical protein
VGLYKQPNDFTCGPYALKHALTVLGVLADPLNLAKLAKTHWWSGTDEVRLARAARAHDCDMPLVEATDAREARKNLVRALAQGYPTLLCVDEWEHWITVVHHAGGKFVILDSRDEPVVAVLTWRQLEARWRYEDWEQYEELEELRELEIERGKKNVDDVEVPVYFDLYAVKPRFRREMRAKFSVTRARFLRRPENRDLGSCWDEYLVDLMEICRPRSPHHVDALSMGELLRRYGDVLLDRVAYWHGSVDPKEVQRITRNLEFVADTYGLVVPAATTRRALVDLAILLGLWSAARVAVQPLFYASEKKRRRRRPRVVRKKSSSKKKKSTKRR